MTVTSCASFLDPKTAEDEVNVVDGRTVVFLLKGDVARDVFGGLLCVGEGEVGRRWEECCEGWVL